MKLIMDIRLNTFITLSKTKSYTKASKLLHIIELKVNEMILTEGLNLYTLRKTALWINS